VRKSIATVSLSGTLEEKLAVAAQVGFDGVEIFENDLVSCVSTAATLRRRADDLGLRFELYQPLRDFEGVPADQLAANLRRADRKFALMNELGVDTLLVCSSVWPYTVDDDALAADQLRRLAERAAGSGIRVAYEALAWGRHVRDYAHAWKIVSNVDHPNLGICLDSFHILSRRLDLDGIAEIPGEKIFFVQLADAPRLRPAVAQAEPEAMDVLQWSRHYRCFPGQGSFDLVRFTRRVLAAGYRGPLSLEVFNDVFRQADAERTATDALRSLIALEDAVARGTGTGPVLPEPPSPHGFAFVEIAVDPLAEMAAEHLLRGLGFNRVARHRSKPVQLWQQAGARVLLNRARPTADWSRGDAAVSAIAVETADPTLCGQRAERLLAPAIPRRYGPGEADLFAVAAPDGTSVFFCQSNTADGWLGDFVAEEPADTQAQGTLHNIDHIGLSQPAYHLDEATLFYQSVLGLRQQNSEEIADPYGLVRSRAMASTNGGVRFVLNVPALGGERLPETAEFQHIAFACPDIFAAAVDMRVRRLPTLPMPANYYDDLAARIDLDEALLATMREYGVLYDRDEGGEYFHFFTAMLGRRMFFEIVQRVGDYDGYGIPNTPVRMAAQYRHTALAGITY
jgi:4-hydroxyphenylpyruvate dioxygenase